MREKIYSNSLRKFREILRYFSEDVNASTVAKFIGLDRKTINKIFSEIIQIIAKQQQQRRPAMRLFFLIALNEKFYFEVGEIELDKSYFSAKRVCGNVIELFRIERESGVHGKIILIGIENFWGFYKSVGFNIKANVKGVAHEAACGCLHLMTYQAFPYGTGRMRI